MRSFKEKRHTLYRFIIIFCLWCLIENWGELPWWVAMGITRDAVACTQEEENNLCAVIEECEVKTRHLQALKVYAQAHEKECGEYQWDICYLCDICLTLYAELYKVTEDSREEGTEKNKYKLKALGHILWHNCQVLGHILEIQGITMSLIEREKS